MPRIGYLWFLFFYSWFLWMTSRTHYPVTTASPPGRLILPPGVVTSRSSE
jgi:hypothetical protein